MSYKVKTKAAKVLVVDDEPEITDIVETFLTESGYQVEVESNPALALEKAREFVPDLILLDIMMPEMDGYSVCQGFKQDAALARTPVIFLTGKDRSDDMGRSFRSGGDMFIKKPFSCERLLEIVNIVLVSTGKH